MKVFSRSFCCTLAVIFCFLSSARAQEYFDGKLIIKYKTEAELSIIRSQQQVDPQVQVQQALQEAGATRVDPVLSFSRVVSMQIQQSPRMREAANNLDRIFEISYTGTTDAKALAAKLAKMPGIEYAEPKYIRRMQFTPSDPTTNPYQQYHRFEDAWDVSQSSSEVVIAIVDGGVNYLHNDLDEKLWVNTDEVNPGVRAQVDEDGNGTITAGEVRGFLNRNGGDYNGDGRITLADALAEGSPLLTGSDTDGNDYSDDIFGWDFWDRGGVTGPAVPDNDPLIDGSDHGTHVAGIAAAETDNNEGIAGAGFNARYMALKAGGIPDDPSTEADESRLIGFGYESIIYAATEGADIINCSWGGAGFSQFENDVVNFATEAGALVVAAAGNDAETRVSFPSGYTQALSVGSVETSGQVSSYSNTGYEVDVFATGSGIQSASFNNDIVSKSGTSMATPVTSGLAALVKALHPGWSPSRIATQIRGSAAILNSSGSRLGHGEIDAYRAVSTNLPGLRILSAEFTNEAGNKLGMAEDGTVSIKIINYGQATTNLRLDLESLISEGVNLNQPGRNVGILASGDSTTVTFDVRFSDEYDLKTVPVFRLNFTDNNANYNDFDIFQYEKILFDIVDANNVKTSFGADGTIGFVNALEGRGGVGFIPLLPEDASFADAENALFEGGLILEADGFVFDAVRGTGNVNKDFAPSQPFTVNRAGEVSAQDGHAIFTFENSGGTTAGSIELETFAFDDPALSNVVFVKYSITNLSQALPMEKVYTGLFNDWDIGENISSNSVAYNSQDSLLYFSGSEDDPIVTVAHLGEISSVLAINNFSGTNPSVDLSNGFSDEEKRAALKAGKTQTSVSSADVSAVTATGPFTVNPEATLTVGFIYAFGHDLETLQNQVRKARAQAPFSVSPTGIVLADEVPEETDLLQNFPNPFRTSTTIRLDLDETAEVKLALYDVLGREVAVIREGQLQAQKHYIPFNPQGLSSGIYFLRLQTAAKTETITITYIK